MYVKEFKSKYVTNVTNSFLGLTKKTEYLLHAYYVSIMMVKELKQFEL
jgi:hypothetical protein